MKDSTKVCRFCGRKIAIITWGVYRKAVVDAEPVWVRPDPEGEDFVRIDGSKVKASPAEIGTIQAEPAYRMHGKTCGRKPS